MAGGAPVDHQHTLAHRARRAASPGARADTADSPGRVRRASESRRSAGTGVGIGTSQERIIELFGDQIETSINDDSSVDLIFVPQDELDAEFRVIFTIRDGVVETYRSGRVPQVTDADTCGGN